MANATPPPPPSLVSNERSKLTAGYLNAAAGSCFTAGVVATIAAALFGVAGAGSMIPPLTLGILIFFGASIGFHVLGRKVLGRLQP